MKWAIYYDTKVGSDKTLLRHKMKNMILETAVAIFDRFTGFCSFHRVTFDGKFSIEPALSSAVDLGAPAGATGCLCISSVSTRRHRVLHLSSFILSLFVIQLLFDSERSASSKTRQRIEMSIRSPPKVLFPLSQVKLEATCRKSIIKSD